MATAPSTIAPSGFILLPICWPRLAVASLLRLTGARCGQLWRPINLWMMQAVHPGDATAHVQPKVWTRDEAARLTEMFPGQRYELIEGELIDNRGQKPPHANVI